MWKLWQTRDAREKRRECDFTKRNRVRRHGQRRQRLIWDSERGAQVLGEFICGAIGTNVG